MTGFDGRPSYLDAPDPGDYPYSDSHDLRVGPPLHKAVQPLLPFIGVWRGRGRGEYPTIEPFEYAQEIRISHDGRPFLAYKSKAWLVTAEGEPIGCDTPMDTTFDQLLSHRGPRDIEHDEPGVANFIQNRAPRVRANVVDFRCLIEGTEDDYFRVVGA